MRIGSTDFSNEKQFKSVKIIA